MNIFKNLDEFSPVKNAVVTTGTFDGVHLGHQKIIKRLKEIANACGGETVLLTFYPHPRMVLYPDDQDLKLLSTQEEKFKLLELFGIDHVIVHPFTKDFSRITSMEFVRNILVNKLKTHKLAIGYNHQFGRNREGTFEHLKEFGPVYGFSVEEIAAQDVDKIEISSTKIRNALMIGDVKTANAFLGYNYALSGVVVKGRQLGRTLGYPTANINISYKYKLVPADGVYAVKVNVMGKSYNGMMSIGKNPTVDGRQRTIEVNIFDFNNDIYDQQIRVEFVAKLREEEKFDGLEALKDQLAKDKEATLKLV